MPQLGKIDWEKVSRLDLPDDVQGWHSDHPIFAELVARTKPANIIEVGSWKGRSAIHLAQLAPLAKLYCVDTWLGGSDHILSDKPQDDLHLSPLGHPQIFEQFLWNVYRAKVHEQITPIPAPSLVGAQVLKHLNVTAELIYIDGSHDYADVFADICAYRELLAPSGLIFGDDYTWPSVKYAVLRYCFERRAQLQQTPDGLFWVIKT